MIVRVRLFAAARELVGSSELAIDMPDGATIADLQKTVTDRVPALERIVPISMWAIGTEYVGRDSILSPHADVALIPPVSGG